MSEYEIQRLERNKISYEWGEYWREISVHYPEWYIHSYYPIDKPKIKQQELVQCS